MGGGEVAAGEANAFDVPSGADMNSVYCGPFGRVHIAEKQLGVFSIFEFPAMILVFVVDWGAFGSFIIVSRERKVSYGGSFKEVSFDGRREGERKLACLDASLHVVEAHKLIVDI